MLSHVDVIMCFVEMSEIVQESKLGKQLTHQHGLVHFWNCVCALTQVEWRNITVNESTFDVPCRLALTVGKWSNCQIGRKSHTLHRDVDVVFRKAERKPWIYINKRLSKYRHPTNCRHSCINSRHSVMFLHWNVCSVAIEFQAGRVTGKTLIENRLPTFEHLHITRSGTVNG